MVEWLRRIRERRGVEKEFGLGEKVEHTTGKISKLHWLGEGGLNRAHWGLENRTMKSFDKLK